MFCFVVVVVGFVVYLREGATPQALPATTVSWETFQRNKQHPIFKFSFPLCCGVGRGTWIPQLEKHRIHIKLWCQCVSFFL